MTGSNRYYERLQNELDNLEREDPKVAAAVKSYNVMVTKVKEGRSHRMPCRDDNCKWHHPPATVADSESGDV